MTAGALECEQGQGEGKKLCLHRSFILAEHWAIFQ